MADHEGFGARLAARAEAHNSRVCLGIDPRPDGHPRTGPRRRQAPFETAQAIAEYFGEILEATHDLLACVKLQSAFFEALGRDGLAAMELLLAGARARGLPVILDVKRGDVPATAAAYADAYLRGGPWAADAVTISPYLGRDSLEPFVTAARRHGRGVFVLVKTSNPGSRDLQELRLADGRRLYQAVAEMVAELAAGDGAGSRSAVGAVVGGTYPRELLELRSALPNSLLLIPGYGAQGATAGDLAAAFAGDPWGAVVSASRSLCYGLGAQVGAEARERTLRMRDEINLAVDSLEAPATRG